MVEKNIQIKQRNGENTDWDNLFPKTKAVMVKTEAGTTVEAHVTDSTIHVTASEKNTWNAKASTAVATTSANGLMSSTDKTKLDGVAANANNYAHPTGDGNLHVPATGTTNNGKVLKAGATAGSAAWGNLTAADVGASPEGHTHAYLPLAGGTMTGDITLKGNPSQNLHPATKQYVDGLVQGLDTKESVKVATTANITLSGTQTIDDIVLVAGDRVLVKDQTDKKTNGIYIVSASGWIRATDADTSVKLSSGTYTFVEKGTINHDSGWNLITDDVVLGTSDIVFTQFSGAGSITPGTGLEKSGNTISISNTGVAPGTYTKVTVNQQGQATSGGALAAIDIPNLDAAKIASGTFPIARIPTGTTSTTVATGNHTHDYVPTARTVNNKPLTSNITLNNADVGAQKEITVSATAPVTPSAGELFFEII